MELFSGTVDADGTIIWDPFDGGGNLVIDSGAYAFPNDSLGWINCDYFGNWVDRSPRSRLLFRRFTMIRTPSFGSCSPVSTP
ncbi:MAG: hypothetical protein IPG74_05280 [Flavobacteriales bacterium]|nr:hypothetical protein [Flavobacteriales bacterium]